MSNPFNLPSLGASLALGLGLDWWKKRQAAKAESAVGDPPAFTPAQVHQFTSALGNFRAFDHDTAGVTLAMLASRSAVPATDAYLQQFGQVWKVVPLQQGAQSALDVVMAGHANPNLVVLGSLSLVLLPNGSPLPMVLVIGPAAAQMLAVREGTVTMPDGTRPGGKFALLRPLPPEMAAAMSQPPSPQPQPPQSPSAHVGAAPPAPAHEAPAPAPEPAPAPAASVAQTVADFEAKAAKEVAAKRNGLAPANGRKDADQAIIAEHTVTTEK